MNQHEADLLVMGSSFGLLAGTWIGYKLRSLRETKDQWKQVSQSYKRLKQEAKDTGVPMIYSPRQRVERETPREVPMRKVIPITETTPAPAPAPKSVALTMQDVCRDVVIRALTEAGYKKSEAATYADMCNPADRMSVETWTAAALRRAVLSK